MGLLDEFMLGGSRGEALGILDEVAEPLNVFVELIMVPPQEVGFLHQVVVIVLEVFLTDLAVVGRRSQVFNFLDRNKDTTESEEEMA